MKVGKGFRSSSLVTASVFAACAAVAAALSAQDADSVAPAVVRILGAPRAGTGVVVAIQDGVATILTASHVIQGVAEFRVAFAAVPNAAPVTVQSDDLIGMQPDETNGLAAFRVRGVPRGVQAAALADRADLKTGDPLEYWGYPNNANTRRRLGGNVSGFDGTLLIMDRPAGEGASGGPVSSHGRVVGIATSTDAQSTFAVVVDVAAVALRGWGVQLRAVTASAGATAERRPPTRPDAARPADTSGFSGAIERLLGTARPEFPPDGACGNLSLDLTTGRMNGIAPTASQDEVKKAFGCFTGSTADGQSFNYGGGVFFLNHDFFFYTGRDFLEVRKRFAGRLSLPLIGATSSAVRKLVGEPDFVATGGRSWLFTRPYGCLWLELEGDTVAQIDVHYQSCDDTRRIR
jgi:hypothetical protein